MQNPAYMHKFLAQISKEITHQVKTDLYEQLVKEFLAQAEADIRPKIKAIVEGFNIKEMSTHANLASWADDLRIVCELKEIS